jgi:hypothetical protein
MMVLSMRSEEQRSMWDQKRTIAILEVLQDEDEKELRLLWMRIYKIVRKCRQRTSRPHSFSNETDKWSMCEYSD